MSPRHLTSSSQQQVLLLTVLSLGALSCSTDSDTVSLAPSAPGAGEPSSDSSKPLYILTTRVSATDSQQSYLLGVPSLAAGARFDLERAVELESSDNNITGLPGTPYVFVGSCTEPTVTRWEARADGSLVKGPSISFARFGLSDACLDTTPLFSKDKAYFVQNQSSDPVIVVWNPSAMEVVGSIPLPDVGVDGSLLPYVSLSSRSDRLFATAFWQESFDEDWTHFGDHVRVIEIDPQTDRILGQTDEPRCNELFSAGSTSDGTLFFSPGSFDAPVRSILGAGRGVDPCLLRIVPPAASFDQGYQLDLESLAGGRPAGDLTVLDDDVAFLHVWHSEVVDPVAADLSNWEDVIGQAGFFWWKWSIGSDSAEPIPDQEPANGVVLFKVDGRKFVTRFSDDYTSTTLDELDPVGALNPGLSGPGQVFGVVRVR